MPAPEVNDAASDSDGDEGDGEGDDLYIYRSVDCTDGTNMPQ